MLLFFSSFWALLGQRESVLEQMEWWHKVSSPARRMWRGVSTRFRIRKYGNWLVYSYSLQFQTSSADRWFVLVEFISNFISLTDCSPKYPKYQFVFLVWKLFLALFCICNEISLQLKCKSRWESPKESIRKG